MCIYIEFRIPAVSTRPQDGATTHPTQDSRRQYLFNEADLSFMFLAESNLLRRQLSLQTSVQLRHLRIDKHMMTNAGICIIVPIDVQTM